MGFLSILKTKNKMDKLKRIKIGLALNASMLAISMSAFFNVLNSGSAWRIIATIIGMSLWSVFIIILLKQYKKEKNKQFIN